MISEKYLLGQIVALIAKIVGNTHTGPQHVLLFRLIHPCSVEEVGAATFEDRRGFWLKSLYLSDNARTMYPA